MSGGGMKYGGSQQSNKLNERVSPQTLQPVQPLQTMQPVQPVQTMKPYETMQPSHAVHTVQPLQTMQPLPVQHMPLTTTLNPHPVQHNALLRGDRQLFTSSDDNVMMRQIQATHAPDGREVNVKPLLHIVEDIVHRASPSFDGAIHEAATQAHMDALEDKTHHADFAGMLEALAYTIHKISCEISCKCLDGGDAHSTTLALCNTLSSYSWDAKVVIALAAFAVNYGEFWLVAQLYTTNNLAKSVALLKQVPDILEHGDLMKPRFEALKTLIKAMLDVTKCIVEFKDLPAQYISHDQPPMSLAMAHIPTAAYWTIRSVVACSSQMISLIGLGHEYITSTTEAWELSSLAHKVTNIHGHLTKQLAVCYQHIDAKRHVEAYNMLVRLFDSIHIDNMKVLRALIYAHDDLPPLVEGSTRKRVHLDVLRRKNVLLLITDLDISQTELSILEQMYRESRHQPTRIESQYEVVWLPFVDKTLPWTEVQQTKLENLQALMPWYFIHHPSIIDPAVTKYIKEVWRFEKKPILVVLDPQGKVVSRNALHMMWIWGSLAFPFTSMREEALWNEETWRLELLVDGIDPTILNWINEGRFICLYGGEDIEWIRKFTTTAQAVARASSTPIELVYVGKSNPKERVRKNIATITVEKLGHCWQDLTSIWFFWVRLESMWYSKMQQGKTVENDTIMQEIMTMLSFDGSEQGWAVIFKGSGLDIAKAKGETILTSFTEFEAWKEHIDTKGFIPALNDHLHQLHTPHHCNRLILPGTGSIPEMVVCSECSRPMEKYIMYRCCTD